MGIAKSEASGEPLESGQGFFCMKGRNLLNSLENKEYAY